MSIFDDISTGKYDVLKNLFYPERPKTPAMLNKIASKLTTEEMASLGKVKSEYDTAMEEYRIVVNNFNNKTAALNDLFHQDLKEAFFRDHPNERLLFSHAWNKCHSEGYAAVAREYEDLSELIWAFIPDW